MNVHPTLELSDAASKDWDIVVVGAGPAGAMAARQIAQLGTDVLLLDKARFPRNKVCGCCFNQDSQSTLQAAGLGNLIDRLGAIPIQRFRIGAAGSRIADLSLTGTVCVSRQAFDAALVAAAVETGAAFLPQTEARLAASTDGFRGLKLRRENVQTEIRTRILLAADGVGSSLMSGSNEVNAVAQKNSRIGAGVVVDMKHHDYEPGTIYMACSDQGYVGLARLEDSRLDIAAALDPSKIKEVGGIGPLAVKIISDAHLPEIPGLDRMKWQGTPLLTKSVPKLYFERAFLIGDAAGYVEPFTGEGIAWALASGVAVAPIANRAVGSWDPSFGDEWSREHRRLVKRRQWLCRLLAKGLRHPRLTSGAVNVLSRFPFLASPLMRAITTSRIRQT